MNIESIGDTQRRALIAALNTPDKAFQRACGGWWIARHADGTVTSFTTRTVYAMGRAWLVDVIESFTNTAPLTEQGLRLAQQLHDDAIKDKAA